MRDYKDGNEHKLIYRDLTKEGTLPKRSQIWSLRCRVEYTLYLSIFRNMLYSNGQAVTSSNCIPGRRNFPTVTITGEGKQRCNKYVSVQCTVILEQNIIIF